MAHIHAELMMQYAEDAKHHDSPWKLWQRWDGKSWVNCTIHPGWYRDKQYRRKPKTIKIGDYEVPEPCREPLELNTNYWTFNPFFGVVSVTWMNDFRDQTALKGGFVHLDRQSAEQHYEAIKDLLTNLQVIGDEIEILEELK